VHPHVPPVDHMRHPVVTGLQFQPRQRVVQLAELVNYRRVAVVPVPQPEGGAVFAPGSLTGLPCHVPLASRGSSQQAPVGSAGSGSPLHGTPGGIPTRFGSMPSTRSAMVPPAAAPGFASGSLTYMAMGSVVRYEDRPCRACCRAGHGL